MLLKSKNVTNDRHLAVGIGLVELVDYHLPTVLYQLLYPV